MGEVILGHFDLAAERVSISSPWVFPSETLPCPKCYGDIVAKDSEISTEPKSRWVSCLQSTPSFAQQLNMVSARATSALRASLRSLGSSTRSSANRGYATQTIGYGREVEGFVGAVGNTPLIRLNRLSEETGCNILAKAEFMSPGGSVKDRAALYLVKDAEEQGLIRPGGTVVEGTAGNTGIGLAHVCRSKGYQCVIYMPDTQSQEKIDLLRMLGADVRPVPGESKLLFVRRRPRCSLSEDWVRGCLCRV